MPRRVERTSCVQCMGKTKEGNRCKLMSCKWSPMCHHHRDTFIDDSDLPNAGKGVFAKRDIKKDTKIADYTVGTEKMTHNQLNQ